MKPERVNNPVDVYDPEFVEVEVDWRRMVVYVHANGLTLFQAGNCQEIVINHQGGE